VLSLSAATPCAAQLIASVLPHMLTTLADAAASPVGGHMASPVGGHMPLRFENLGLSPIALDLRFFTIKWYSLAYLVGIIFAYWHLTRELRLPGAPMAQRHAEDLFFYATLGVIFGGRLGYAVFYAPELLTHPLELIKLYQGGMSFHGGLIGTTLAIAWVSWRGRLDFIRVCDYIAPISSMESCGAAPPIRRCHGRWSFPAAARPRAIPASCTRPGSKGSCWAQC